MSHGFKISRDFTIKFKSMRQIIALSQMLRYIGNFLCLYPRNGLWDSPVHVGYKLLLPIPHLASMLQVDHP